MCISGLGAPGAVYTPPVHQAAPPPAPPAPAPAKDADGDGDNDKGGVDIKV
jgi:hypothetical protein